MGIFLTVVGVAVIAVGLVDMFHTLLHPSGKGYLSSLVLSAVWRVSKATGHRLGSAVGPAAMVAVILLWVALEGVGWALIYFPDVPGGFMYSSGINPSAYPELAEALYVSFVTLATLGFGDVVPTDPWIRLASPAEALTGVRAADRGVDLVHPALPAAVAAPDAGAAAQRAGRDPLRRGSSRRWTLPRPPGCCPWP